MNQQNKEMVLEEISKAQAKVMSLVEVAVTDKETWRKIRTHLLNAFGNSGLYGTVQKILKMEGSDE